MFTLWRRMRHGLVLRDAAEPLWRGQQPALVVTGEPVPSIVEAHPGAIPTAVPVRPAS